LSGNYYYPPGGCLAISAIGLVVSTTGLVVFTTRLELFNKYKRKTKVTVHDIVDFHYRFESIHPFQDGNGRVGRIIMFKECLKHDIMPFIINHRHQAFYYRGLREYAVQKGYLTYTCVSAQDEFAAMASYFYPEIASPGPKRGKPE